METTNTCNILAKKLNRAVYQEISPEISPRNLFINLFDEFPNVVYFDEIDTNAAIEVLLSDEKYTFWEDIRYWSWDSAKSSHYRYLVLESGLILYFEEVHNLVQILYAKSQNNLVLEIGELVEQHKMLDRTERNKVWILVNQGPQNQIKAVQIKSYEFNLSEHYNDDLLEHDALLEAKLSEMNSSGLSLLYGKPGTGKTWYLRHLIHRLEKEVIFIPPQYIPKFGSPEFLSFLLKHRNSVLIIEDADVALLSGSSLDKESSVLLNLTDGLLGDSLNIHIVCTFNGSLARIAPSLKRKGRLLMHYEFKELDRHKSERLCERLGNPYFEGKAMLLSDIFNPEKNCVQEESSKIGFKN